MKATNITQIPNFLSLTTNAKTGATFLKINETESGSAPSRSVVTPSAQSSGLCCQPLSVIAATFDFFSAVQSNSYFSSWEKLFLEIMYLSGCRVSEVLSLRYSNFSANGLLLIKSSKGSRNLVIRLHYNSINSKLIHVSNELLFPNINRFFIYRLFKRHNLYYIFSGHTNYSVTHFFRKLLANEAYSINKDLGDITTALHHSSKKSAVYYRH